MRPYRGSIILVLLAAFTSGGCCHRCRPAFDNFATGQSYQLVGNEAVQGTAASGGYNATANAFTSARAGRLCRVVVATGLKSGSNAVELRLMTDGANRPATVLESWHVSGQMKAFGTPAAPVTVSSVQQPSLQAGTQYWLVALPGAPDTMAGWNEALVPPNGPIDFSADGISWPQATSGERGAFRVDVR
jgi:hypothetical protein